MNRIKDTAWIKQSFMLRENAIDDQDIRRRVLTSAAVKFTDTTLGGNFAINAPPQWTRFADIKVGGSERGKTAYMPSSGRFLTNKETGIDATNGADRQWSPSRGMGRTYSEIIDDNAQHVVMRFGLPTFNSLTMFFGQFYDAPSSLLARTGRAESAFFTLGKAAGFLVALPFKPIILGMSWYRFMSNSPPSKFYYMTPRMALYWNAVNTMVNAIGVNIGMVPEHHTEGQRKVFGHEDQIEKSDLQEYAKHLPDLFTNSGGIDVYAVGTRAQRIANVFNTKISEEMGKTNNIVDSVRRMMRNFWHGMTEQKATASMDSYLKAYLSTNEAKVGNAMGDSTEMVGDRKNLDEPIGAYNSRNDPGKSWGSRLVDFWEGERRDGGMFVTFKVDYSGTASESFSNSVGESSIAQKINSASASARSTRFDFADGNVGGGAVGDIVQGVLKSAKDVLSGVLQSVSLQGLASLAGSAFVDIPKTWNGSTANLPRADYTIELRSPYGNNYSRMQNLYIPLAMLLAGALPLSTGKHSYTSPFICELFCRGRTAIRLGMIESISITRGTGNVGWTQEGEPLGIDVSFSVVDLSSVLHMPITANFDAFDAAMIGTAGIITDAAGGSTALGQDLATRALTSTYDDDNAFTDYMAVLGSLSFADQIYANRRWHLARMRQMRNFETFVSPAHAASWFFGTWPGRVINAVSLETDRIN